MSPREVRVDSSFHKNLLAKNTGTKRKKVKEERKPPVKGDRKVLLKPEQMTRGGTKKTRKRGRWGRGMRELGFSVKEMNKNQFFQTRGGRKKRLGSETEGQGGRTAQLEPRR